MSERVAVIKAKWLACAICWVALMFVFAVSWWVYGTRGANPVDGGALIALFIIPIGAGASYLTERWEFRRRASRHPTSRLPRSFRKKRRWPGPQDMGWWIFIGLAVVCSIGGVLWVPDSRLILIGVGFLLANLGTHLGDLAFLSTHDEQD
jgi:hypothetical protein